MIRVWREHDPRCNCLPAFGTDSTHFGSDRFASLRRRVTEGPKQISKMARSWKCEICLLFTSLTLKTLVRHIAVEHAGMPNFKVKCGVDGCPEEYTKMNSYRKHLRTCHGHEYSFAGRGTENLQVEGHTSIVDDDSALETNSGGESDVREINDDDDVDNERFNLVLVL